MSLRRRRLGQWTVILRKRLPYSAAAVKQEHREGLKVRWKEEWQSSPRFARFQHIDPNFPFNKYRQISDRLSRSQASLLMQLRTGHVPLNCYLYRITKSVTRHCDACWRRRRQEIPETIVHFLFECQEYAGERYDMDRVLGRHSRDLQAILASLDHIKELLKYVGRTARFKKSLGDALGDVAHLESEEG